MNYFLYFERLWGRIWKPDYNTAFEYYIMGLQKEIILYFSKNKPFGMQSK
jgi:hypothetical protein